MQLLIYLSYFFVSLPAFRESFAAEPTSLSGRIETGMHSSLGEIERSNGEVLKLDHFAAFDFCINLNDDIEIARQTAKALGYSCSTVTDNQNHQRLQCHYGRLPTKQASISPGSFYLPLIEEMWFAFKEDRESFRGFRFWSSSLPGSGDFGQPYDALLFDGSNKTTIPFSRRVAEGAIRCARKEAHSTPNSRVFRR
jgi:hypothetical protein